MRFYTTLKLGEKRSLTPEGFLLCEDVPIARVGDQLYGPNEIHDDEGNPIPVGPHGYIVVNRSEAEVFNPNHVASYNGKPIANDHPDSDVTPANYRTITCGVVMNPRRGVGLLMDLLIADLMIQEEEAIRDVMNGKDEVSCGYDADYEEVEAGKALQKNLIGNHVALVDSGRCGQRCAIGDSNPFLGELEMANHTRDNQTLPRRTLLAASIRHAMKTRDEKGMEELAKKVEDGEGDLSDNEQHIHIHSAEPTSDDALQEHIARNDADHAEFRDRLDALEALLKGTSDSRAKDEEEKKAAEEKEATEKKAAEDKARDEEKEIEEELPAGTADAARKTNDSSFLDTAWQETVSMAEIVAPGIQLPAYDRAAPKKTTFDSICAMRRSALELGNTNPDTRALIEAAHGKPLVTATLTTRDSKALFRSVAAMKKVANNGQRTASRTSDIQQVGVAGKIKSLADLNKANSEYYKIH